MGGLLVILLVADAGEAPPPVSASIVGAFTDGPPARVTGGFGEDSCIACHFGEEENDGQGALRVKGLPEVVSPGETYALVLELIRPGTVTAGFQLAVRHAEDGMQAGELAIPHGDEERIAILSERGVSFAHHLRSGRNPVSPDTARWSIQWTAPVDLTKAFVHVAAVAGDGDESQFGDYVYTYEAELTD